MLGRSHALSGLAAFTVVGLAAFPQTDPFSATAYALTATGAALWPDMDFHRRERRAGKPDRHVYASMAYAYGPVTKIAARLLSRLGHRDETHTLAAAGIAGVLTACAAVLHPIAMGAALWLCWGPAISVFRKIPWPSVTKNGKLKLKVKSKLPWPLLAGSTALLAWGAVSQLPLTWWTTALAVTVGYLSGVLGDCLTNSGCPLLWPWTRRRFTLDLFSTGHWQERVIVVPLLSVIGTVTAWFWVI